MSLATSLGSTRFPSIADRRAATLSVRRNPNPCRIVSGPTAANPALMVLPPAPRVSRSVGNPYGSEHAPALETGSVVKLLVTPALRTATGTKQPLTQIGRAPCRGREQIS